MPAHQSLGYLRNRFDTERDRTLLMMLLLEIRLKMEFQTVVENPARYVRTIEKSVSRCNFEVLRYLPL